MFIDRGIDKKRCVHIHSAIRKNEIMPFAATWMDLEIVKLSKADRQISYSLFVES